MISCLKYILPVTLFFAVGGMGNLCAQEQVVNVTQWGAKPDDGKDDTKAQRWNMPVVILVLPCICHPVNIC